MNDALKEALKSKNIPIVQRFTSKGRKSLNDDKFLAVHLIKNKWSLTKVMELDNPKLTKLFLQNNNSLKINNHNSDGRTALHEAVMYCNVDHVKLLLDHNADPNSLDNMSWTPMYYLYNRDYRMNPVPPEEDILKVIKMLINYGANASTKPTKKNKDIDMPVKFILANGSVNAIESVLNMKSIDFYKHYGSGKYTVLHHLARNSNEWQRLMRDRDFDVNAKTFIDQTALWIAARLGNVETVRFLLDRGADPNIPNNGGMTPINAAAEHFYVIDKYLNCIELLLQHGAKFQKPSSESNGLTMFEIVSKQNNDNFCKMLLSQMVLEEANGVKIENHIKNKIVKDYNYKKHYEACKELVETEIYPSITLAKLLTCREEKLIPYLRNLELVESLSLFSDYLESNDSGYYYRFLDNRLTKACEVTKLRDSATVAISKLMEIYYPHILDNILNNLEHRDLIALQNL